MTELLHKLGINWKLLLSQAVNFLVLMIALTFLLYKPLLKMMRERRQKIELGIRGAEEAQLRIAQAEQIKKQKIAMAESEAISIIKAAENSAQKEKEQILLEARKRFDSIIKESSDLAERQRLEALSGLLSGAKHLVKEAIIKTVSLSPREIDEKLIERSIAKLREEKKL